MTSKMTGVGGCSSHHLQGGHIVDAALQAEQVVVVYGEYIPTNTRSSADADKPARRI